MMFLRGKLGTAEFQKTCHPGVPFHFFHSLCTRTVQSGFVPHVTFLVQKLGRKRKKWKEKLLKRNGEVKQAQRSDTGNWHVLLLIAFYQASRSFSTTPVRVADEGFWASTTMY
jgi:hypothetical protein